MRILYFSDGWGYRIMGIKRIMLEELVARGIDVIYQNKANIHNVLELVKTLNPDQVWLAHTMLTLPCDISMIKKPVVGFGFSDSHYFSETILKNYDIYITSYYKIYLKYKNSMPIYYCTSVCNTRYFTNLGLKRDIDILHVSTAIHPRFKNKRERIEVINRLREDTDLDIRVYGWKWPEHEKNFGYLTGSAQLKTINRSKLALDIQDDLYAPTSRLFDCAACATPSITREGDDILALFEKDKEILTYNNYEELKEKLIYYQGNPEKLRDIGLNAQKRCIKDYDIKIGMDGLLAFLEEEIGGKK